MSGFRAREAEIYIAGRTQRRLRWITNAEGKIRTPDELADLVLNEWIELKYPQIKTVESKLKKAEQEFSDSFNKEQAA